MGYGGLTEWFTGEIKLTKHEKNEEFESNPFGKRRIYIIPLFHYSIIPCVRQKHQASINPFVFSPALAGYKFRDIELVHVIQNSTF